MLKHFVKQKSHSRAYHFKYAITSPLNIQSHHPLIYNYFTLETWADNLQVKKNPIKNSNFKLYKEQQTYSNNFSAQSNMTRYTLSIENIL